MTEIEPKEYDIIIKKNPLDTGTVILKVPNYHIWESIKNKFTFMAENYQFSPKYKSGIWNGKICLIKKDGFLPIGLVDDLCEFAVKKDYNVKIEFVNFVNYSKEKIQNWIDTLNIPFELRDYQFQSFYDAITKRNSGCIIVTGGGKSVCLYLIARFAQRLGKRTLIVVPRIPLIEQLKKDFLDYGMTTIESDLQIIEGGLTKTFEKDIIISTYHSIAKLQSEHFDSIGCVCIDESHGSDSESIRQIHSNCKKTDFRFGCTGTLPCENISQYMAITGMFGKFHEYLNHQQATERGYISPMNLNAIFFNYTDSDREVIYENKKNYQFELDFVYHHHTRNMAICKLVSGLTKNTLILFTRIEEHGKIIEQYIKEYTKKQIRYIDGKVKSDTKEDIRCEMEDLDGVVLLASYGTFSTGINVKNIHNVIFASDYVSEVTVFQSIGRGLRTLDDKTLNVFDLVDVLSSHSYTNYMVDHYQKRLEKYKLRDFNIIKRTINL